jgi:pSer/pThr/pTyr-binding forkhead associated (FHA) protein
VPPFVLDVLKYAFLTLLYFFVYQSLRSTAVDLAGGGRGRASRSDAPAVSQREARRARGRTKTPRKLVVVDGGGGKPGTIRLEEALQVGRAEACQIRLGDTYISQFHARLFPRDGTWYIEDLGSTNGTYLNQRKLTGPSEVHAGDVVRLGKTTLELKG